MRNCPKSVWLGEREDYPIFHRADAIGVQKKVCLLLPLSLAREWIFPFLGVPKHSDEAVKNKQYQVRFGQPKKISAKM
jgi:hypothetical protein